MLCLRKIQSLLRANVIIGVLCTGNLGQVSEAISCASGKGISVLGDTQKPSGHCPAQPALGDPAQVGRLDKLTSRGPRKPKILSSEHDCTLN